MYGKYVYSYSEEERNELIKRCKEYAHCDIKQSDADRILMYKEFICIKAKTEAKYTQREFAKEKGLKEPVVSERLTNGRFKLYNMLKNIQRILLASGKFQCDLTVLQAIFDIDTTLTANILRNIYYSRGHRQYWPPVGWDKKDNS